MTLLHTKRFSSWARGHLLCRVDDVPDRFAITFDDGPNPRATEKLLDILGRHGARGTFFLLCTNVRQHADLARRIVSSGSEVAVHGDTHWPVPLLMPWAIRTHVRRCAAAIEDATGVRPYFYRPPFGFLAPGQAQFVRSLGFEPVLGDIYPEDPQRPGVDRIVGRVLPRLRGGSIVILHDGSPLGPVNRDQTVDAVGRILTEAARRDLRATTVQDLLGPVPEPAS
jgi:peptidoglycan/xylan/chitin deacetylase (PgdA/CDA1 family)